MGIDDGQQIRSTSSCTGLSLCDWYAQRSKQGERQKPPHADWYGRTHNSPCAFTYESVACKGPLVIVLQEISTKAQEKHLRSPHIYKDVRVNKEITYFFLKFV